MILHTALFPILLAGAAIAQDRPVLRGTVRDRDDGAPIARVLVELAGTARHAWSDSLGSYELSLPEGGPKRIRLSRLGYEGIDLGVVLPTSGEMRLDLTLRARPVALSGVRLESGRDGTPRPRAAGRGSSGPEIGYRSFGSGDRQAGAPFGEPDVLWAVSAAPDVVLRAGLPTSLHVRGGSADQNLVLLDGIPVFSPHHAGGVLSAIPPDAVAEVELHGGIPPASLGGALSSAIEIHTREVPRRGLASRGGFGLRGLRGAFAHGLPGGSGGALLAGRRSHRTGFPGGDDGGRGGFGDLLAKLTVDLPGGGIDALTFASEDHLAFRSAPEIDDDAPGGGDDFLQPEMAAAESQNRFGWTSRALGLSWRRAWAGGANAEVRAWHSGFEATLDWAAEGGGVRLRSARSQAGVQARLDGPLAGGTATAGVGLEWLRVRYGVGRLEGPGAVWRGDALLALESDAAVPSLFIDQTWRPGQSWFLRAGVRGQIGPAGRLLAEPRLSLSLAPSPDVLFSAGYARAHQAVQSLRNEESILDAVAGIDLPIVAGMPGVPVARSDQLAAAVVAKLGTRTTVEIEAYTRWLGGLVLVAPATSQPFALSGFETGTGRAWGTAVLLEHHGPRLAARATYARGTVIRRAEGVHYHTTFERPHSIAATVDWRARAHTRMTAGLLAGAGSPTTPFERSFAWEPFDALGGDGELEGSPQRTAGPLNGERLPPYLRLDLGLHREWGARWLGEGAVFAAHLGVLNLLDRRNVLGYAIDPDTGARRPLTLLGRALTFGLDWRY